LQQIQDWQCLNTRQNTQEFSVFNSTCSTQQAISEAGAKRLQIRILIIIIIIIIYYAQNKKTFKFQYTKQAGTARLKSTNS